MTFLVKNIKVEAVLYDENGKILDKVNGNSKIKNIRPGEAAPVVLESDIETSKVKRVEWNVKVVGTSAEVDRDGIVLIADAIPFGVPEYKGFKRQDPPNPYTLITTLRNLSKKDWRSAELVVAWVNPEGKVVEVQTAPLAEDYNGVVAGGSAVFQDIIIHDPTVGLQLNESEIMTWVVGYP